MPQEKQLDPKGSPLGGPKVSLIIYIYIFGLTVDPPREPSPPGGLIVFLKAYFQPIRDVTLLFLWQILLQEYFKLKVKKIPHTRNTESLDRSGQQDQYNFERLRYLSNKNMTFFQMQRDKKKGPKNIYEGEVQKKIWEEVNLIFFFWPSKSFF